MVRTMRTAMVKDPAVPNFFIFSSAGMGRSVLQEFRFVGRAKRFEVGRQIMADGDAEFS